MSKSLLKTEENSEEMGERIDAAAEAYFIEREHLFISTFYEHGQWWAVLIFADDDDETYSVVDAVGGDSVDGFSFERI